MIMCTSTTVLVQADALASPGTSEPLEEIVQVVNS